MYEGIFENRLCSIICIQLSMCLIIGDHSQGAGGNSHHKSVMVHLDYADDKKRKGNIEELFLHEAAHACLDQHMKVSYLVTLDKRHHLFG